MELALTYQLLVAVAIAGGSRHSRVLARMTDTARPS